MATHHRQQPSRLIIPPHLNNLVDSRPMFSPSLHTANQPNFPPVFPLQPPHTAGLQTPLQTSFFPQGPPGPRPGHRVHPSIAQFAPAGVHGPLNLPPMTPLTQGQFPPMMMGSQPQFGNGQPFVPKSRRTPSTIGGPPKAPLGGPGRKHSPMPAPAVAAIAAQEKVKKKVVVKLPLESAEEGAEGKSLWSRVPLDPESVKEEDVAPPEIITANVSPEELERTLLPPTVEVFLPGKSAWDDLRRREIDEKLAKLNIEGVSDQVVPEIHAPHARAASISSPADPALLLFKLNKLRLQQDQNVPSSSPLSTSPHPPASVSPNPNNAQMPPRLQGHGHSMSMVAVNAPVFHPSMYNGNSSGFNMFGFPLQVNDHARVNSVSPVGIYAPQGRAPVHLNVAQTPSRSESRPDFVRGFGLEIPEEEEPEEEEQRREQEQETNANENASIAGQPQFAPSETTAVQTVDVPATVEVPEEVKPAVHTRHASRISVALSIGSTKQMEAVVKGDVADEEHVQDEVVEQVQQVAESDAVDVDEWTGSEDVQSDEESIGEWSNPSDEERARQARAQRRMRRRMLGDPEVPRKIPNFPRPPEDSYVQSLPDDDEHYSKDVEDDIISNPSDEEHGHRLRFSGVRGSQLYAEITSPESFQGSRPLPPLPHSRNGSGHWSYYSNAGTQSPSEIYNQSDSRPSSSAHQTSGSISFKKDVSLNPHAKPFVFGGARTALATLPSSTSLLNASTEANAASSTQQTPEQSSAHARRPSLGSSRVLNAAAQEFKPGSFTFTPPAGVPKLTFPEPQPIIAPAVSHEPPRPLPIPPILDVVAVQGREKRSRVSESLASATDEDEDEDEDKENREHLSAFRFPPTAEAASLYRRSAPTSPTLKLRGQSGSISAPISATTAKPYTISGFSSLVPPTVPPVGKDLSSYEDSYASDESDVEQQLDESETRADVDAEIEDASPDTLHFMSNPKQKRAPIPLDFTHPVSTNKVPAGLFKNYVNADGDDRTRISTRAVIDSISDHRSQISLDDLSMPAISHKVSRARLNANVSSGVDEDNIPLAELARNSSQTRRFERPSISLGRPTRRMQEDEVSEMSESQSSSPMRSPGSIVPPDIGAFTNGLRFENHFEDVLDKKFEELRSELASNAAGGYDIKFISSSTEELVKDAIAMFRTQMRASAERELDDDSRRDARGELDFELIRNIVEQGHEDTRQQFQRDLVHLANTISSSKPHQVSTDSMQELVHLIHDMKNNVMASNARVSDRIAAIEATTSQTNPRQERDAIVYEVVHALTPVVTSVQPEPLDYDSLTTRLSQAVKPHISQLIDLASDKRETAELIATRLMPILQTFTQKPPTVDTESIISEMTTAINKVIAPIDAHVIKEQVADLVVERLDARLSVRESQINLENLKTKVSEVVLPIIKRMDDLVEDVGGVSRDQSELYSQTADILERGTDTLNHLDDLKGQLSSLVATIDDVKTSISLNERGTSDAHVETRKYLERIETALQSHSTVAETAPSAEVQEILTVSRQILSELSPVPNTIENSMQSMELKQTEVMKRLLAIQESTEELHRQTTSTTDLQAQLVKARAAHGQIRVEKDNLNERLAIAEVERDRLRAKVEEAQVTSLNHATELATLQARATEQENAMHSALERLKVADVNAQTQHDRIAELEKANRELVMEKQQLKSKVDGLEMQLNFAQRDKDSVSQMLQLIQNERDHLASQQAHWDELRRAAEKIETLSNLMEHRETEELAELRRTRDRTKVLEAEHAALQKRYKDQESKISSLERASSTMRQNFAQSQQRCAEWEKKYKEHEAEIERLTTMIDQSEQSKGQLETDLSLARLQIEEHDSEVRMSKERERTLREELALSQNKVSSLSSENEDLRKQQSSPTEQWNIVPKQNGVTTQPYSRASTDYDSPPTPKLSHTPMHSAPPKKEVSPPTSSTWDSMHAPKRMSYATQTLTRGRQFANTRRVAAPSPTPSVVSVAPTEGADGWWS